MIDALRGRRLLVILDNCEHVLDVAADLAARVVAACPQVAVVATSREPLAVAGESVWRVRSLEPAEALELLCERARAGDAGFSPSEQDVVLLASICQRLDGIPLALELAAGRLRSMAPADLAERLGDRFRLLRGGRRGGLERHQTLRATIDWSYQLLSADEQALFDRLSVFAGGFDLPAAEAVCGGDPLDPLDVVDLLAGLVDRSMIGLDPASRPHARYRLLETLRQFGEESLHAQGQLAALRDRHLAHYAEVARRAGRQHEGSAYAEGAATFRAEWDNLRAAVQWAAETRDIARASAVLDSALFFAWWDVRYELGDWADQVLDVGAATPTIYGVAAWFAASRGDHDVALRRAQAGVRIAQDHPGDGTWACWWILSAIHWYTGRPTEAHAAIQKANEVIDATKEPCRAAFAAAAQGNYLAWTAQLRLRPSGDDDAVADIATAREHHDRARRFAGPLHNLALDSAMDWSAGIVERSDGNHQAALASFQRALASAQRSGNRMTEGIATLSLAFLAVMTDAEDADQTLREALARLYASRDWINVWPAIEALAVYWWSAGKGEPSAILLGHLEAQDIRHAQFVGQRREVLEALAQEPWAAGSMARGAELDRDAIVAYALGV